MSDNDPIETQWIDDAEALDKLCQNLGRGPVAVDTESDHFHAYQARVCLIQVATDEVRALIDPLALSAEELRPLLDIFVDHEREKVLHSARNDIIELDRDYGVGINNLFDTQIAARFLDYDRSSLDWMLQQLLDVDTGGQYQRYDWSTRPLPDEVRRYASDDVAHLLALRDRFRRELEAEQWFGPFSQQCQYVTASVAYEAGTFDPEGWRSLKGSAKLDGRGRAALSALFEWRHELCTELNRSAVTVFPNGALMRLARVRPESVESLSKIGKLPDRLVQDHGASILTVIKEAKKADAPPKKRPRTPYEPPPAAQKARYEALRRWRNEMVKKLALPPEFIATNATIEKIVAADPHTIEDLKAVTDVLAWHRDLLGDDILRTLESCAQ